MGQPRDAGKYPFSCEIKRPLEQSKYPECPSCSRRPPRLFFFFAGGRNCSPSSVLSWGAVFPNPQLRGHCSEGSSPPDTQFPSPQGRTVEEMKFLRLLEFSAERSWWEVRGNLCLKPAPRLARGLDRPFFRPLRKPRVWSERVATRPAPENVPGSVSPAPQPQAGRDRLF